jgi:FkbM family methyltransferase
MYLLSVLCAFYSQCGQDAYIYDHFFKETPKGVFVDIGAHDGITFSNTKFFEELGWEGICIEPIPEVFEKLKKNRSSICVQGCISNKSGMGRFLRIKGHPEMLSGLIDYYDPNHLGRALTEVHSSPENSCEVIPVECFLLNDILEKNSYFHVDYLSLDTEGGELDILQSIDFEKFDIEIVEVENNFGESKIRSFMASKNYEFVGQAGWDDVFRKIRK